MAEAETWDKVHPVVSNESIYWLYEVDIKVIDKLNNLFVTSVLIINTFPIALSRIGLSSNPWQEQ